MRRIDNRGVMCEIKAMRPSLSNSNILYIKYQQKSIGYKSRIHIINAPPPKKVRWYSFRQPKQKTKEVSNANNIYPSNPRRKIPYLHRT